MYPGVFHSGPPSQATEICLQHASAPCITIFGSNTFGSNEILESILSFSSRKASRWRDRSGCPSGICMVLRLFVNSLSGNPVVVVAVVSVRTDGIFHRIDSIVVRLLAVASECKAMRRLMSVKTIPKIEGDVHQRLLHAVNMRLAGNAHQRWEQMFLARCIVRCCRWRKE